MSENKKKKAVSEVAKLLDDGDPEEASKGIFSTSAAGSGNLKGSLPEKKVLELKALLAKVKDHGSLQEVRKWVMAVRRLL